MLLEDAILDSMRERWWGFSYVGIPRCPHIQPAMCPRAGLASILLYLLTRVRVGASVLRAVVSSRSVVWASRVVRPGRPVAVP